MTKETQPAQTGNIDPRQKTNRTPTMLAATMLLVAIAIAVVVSAREGTNRTDTAVPDRTAISDPAASNSESQPPTATKANLLAVTALNGQPIPIPSGRPVILYFFSADACAGCETGAVALNKLYPSLSDRASVIGVEITPGIPVSIVAQFVNDLGLTYPIGHDPDGLLATRFDVSNLSTVTVLDGAGNIIAAAVSPEDTASLTAAVDSAAATGT